MSKKTLGQSTGFKPVPADTPPQKGDVVIIQQAPNHQSGHAAMYDGEKWISDFEQKDIYGSPGLRKNNTPYVIYRRP
ncbi:hypothetical protein [Fundidesulfovibrio butyratiphilus]